MHENSVNGIVKSIKDLRITALIIVRVAVFAIKRRKEPRFLPTVLKGQHPETFPPG